MSLSSHDLSALRDKYDAAGQGHVFTFYDKLTSAEQVSLVAQLVTIDPQRVNDIYHTAITASQVELSAEQGKISPPPPERVGTVIGQAAQASEWNAVGLDAIKHGKVGVLLMAGGQGTRLGSSAPKGCYDIGLPSGKSLFQLQAERIKRLQEVGGGVVPWYIMTSGPTRKPTEEFFAQSDFFGLSQENIIFFEQGAPGAEPCSGLLHFD